METLRSKGVTLRMWQMQDLVSLLTHANNEKIARSLHRKFPYPYSRSIAQSWLEEVSKENMPISNLAIEVNGLAVGGVQLNFDAKIFSAEISFWLGEFFWNKHIASNAVNLSLAYAFSQTDIKSVWAMTLAANTAAVRVLEKTEFKLEKSSKSRTLQYLIFTRQKMQF